MYKVILSKQAIKDSKNLKRANLEDKVRNLLSLLKEDPFKTPPPLRRLVGDLEGLYSRRINRQHRLVYSVDHDKRIVKVLRMWTHYDNL